MNTILPHPNKLDTRGVYFAQLRTISGQSKNEEVRQTAEHGGACL